VGTEYLTADHLGSTRLVTSSTGAERRCLDYLPFGEQMTQGMGARGACYASANEPRVKFTGKERDQETGLDYFGARYLSSAQGRFTTPDPLGVNLLRVISPQRWHMYAYALNNPLVYTDPDGRDAIAVSFRTLAYGAGHLATISVNRDGSARFMDYGPRGGGRPVWVGQYRIQGLQTRLTFSSDGIPLPASFATLAGEVAELVNVDPSTVAFAYFKTTDAETAALNAHIDNLERYSQSWFSSFNLYVVGVHDCAAVCNIALSKAHVGRGTEVADIPNVLFDWLYLQRAHASYSGETGKVKKNRKRELKPDVQSNFIPCREGDFNCGEQ
jgi:RHS repeat-associated protein